ncbi:MAG: hypothetical protein KJ623_00105 [Nanoarchaeota archaeon]|nr:hypothetical protein [Nanoarchaeota archaeon]MBU0963292.1 hypothetical protein [Nanoarchaeota archaeon]
MVSLLTCLEIVGNPEDIIVESCGPDENGKYLGIISRGPDHNYKPLVSTEPFFGTPEEAKTYMQEIIDLAKQQVEKRLKEPNSPLKQYFASQNQ